MAQEVIRTDDGSPTVRSSSFGVTYHSIHGALTESIHVFLNAGFHFRLQSVRTGLHVLEVGLGTGLNALLTVEAARRAEIKVRYTALEPYPLDSETISSLQYTAGDLQHLKEEFKAIHQAPPNQATDITNQFALTILPDQLQDLELAKSVDLVYFDAFAPSAQPEMWTIEALARVRDVMAPGGVLVTYCAQGQFKRNLKSLGFTVEGIPGPPGKREMVRATLEVQESK